MGWDFDGSYDTDLWTHTQQQQRHTETSSICAASFFFGGTRSITETERGWGGGGTH